MVIRSSHGCTHFWGESNYITQAFGGVTHDKPKTGAYLILSICCIAASKTRSMSVMRFLNPYVPLRSLKLGSEVAFPACVALLGSGELFQFEFQFASGPPRVRAAGPAMASGSPQDS